MVLQGIWRWWTTDILSEKGGLDWRWIWGPPRLGGWEGGKRRTVKEGTSKANEISLFALWQLWHCYLSNFRFVGKYLHHQVHSNRISMRGLMRMEKRGSCNRNWVIVTKCLYTKCWGNCPSSEMDVKSSTLLGSEASDIAGQRRLSWRESLETGCAHPSGWGVGGSWQKMWF